MTGAAARPARRLTAFIGLGSNIDPERNVPLAVDHLSRAFSLTAVSTFYRTAPVGAEGRPDFYNGVVSVQANALQDIPSELLRIEARMGRRRTADPNAPRVIDLDLLISTGPSSTGSRMHPDVAARGFVALPLLELAPDLVLPDGHGPLRELAARFPKPPGQPLHALTRALRQRIRRSP